MKYLIWYCDDEGDHIKFFKTEEQMKEEIEVLIKCAEEEMQDNEGQYPHWCNEFTAAKIIGEFNMTDYSNGSLKYKEVK